MNDKTRLYLKYAIFLLLLIFMVPFFYFIQTGHLTWEEFVISIAFAAILALIGSLYSIRYTKKHFGPEWYRIKDSDFIPPEVGKLPKVRFFEGIGALVFFIGMIYGILTHDLIALIVFVGEAI
jgi:hypothetical protein